MGHLSKLTTSALLFGSILLALLAGAPAGAATARSANGRVSAAAATRTHASRTRRHGSDCSTRRAHRRRHACRPTRAHPRHGKTAPTAPKPRAPAPSPATPSAGQAARQASAAAVAAALAAPCPNTQLTPEAGNIELTRQAVLCLVNRERAQRGVAPLKLSHQLEAAAEGHCGELISDDYFAHVSPTGETPVERIRTTGYIPGPSVGYVIGENLAWGTLGLATPQSIVAAWIASPAHLSNILEGRYSETGIGIAPSVPSSLAAGAPGATYAQEFGAIVR